MKAEQSTYKMEPTPKDYISGCGAFSLNSQSVSFLQAYLLLELICSALLAETGGKCPLVFSVNHVTQVSQLIWTGLWYSMKEVQTDTFP